MVKYAPVYIVRSSFRNAGTVEAKRRSDLQIRTRTSRNAPGAVKLGARVARGSILPLSRREKPPQEKAADKL
ncbi:MAG: hypothetical protein ABR514_05810 [Chthoniobacterales bacterium]